jgi:hypothetical protein
VARAEAARAARDSFADVRSTDGEERETPDVAAVNARGTHRSEQLVSGHVEHFVAGKTAAMAEGLCEMRLADALWPTKSTSSIRATDARVARSTIPGFGHLGVEEKVEVLEGLVRFERGSPVRALRGAPARASLARWLASSLQRACPPGEANERG